MKHPVLFALVNVALLVIGALMLHAIMTGPQHHLLLGAASLPQVAICLRYGRAVVSHRIPIPAGLGWHAAENWQTLEVQASREVEAAKGAGHLGPFVYPCSAALAAKATWRLPGQPAQQPLFPESEAH